MRKRWKWIAFLFSWNTYRWTRPRSLLMAPITVMEGPLFFSMCSFMPAVSQHFEVFYHRLNLASTT